jgi:predicted nucleic acid-binding protein
VAIYYFDTSALIKHYLDEIGTPLINSLLYEQSNDLAIVSVTMAEAFAAITRRIRGGELTYGTVEKVLEVARTEFEEKFIVLATTLVVVYRAMALSQTHALRGYDAIQLAAALEFQNGIGKKKVTFVCADDELNRTAAREGLSILNPNNALKTL